MKRALVSLGLAALALTGSAAVGGQTLEPVYDYYYYSDASRQTLVGVQRGDCTYWGVSAYFEWGTYSDHREDVHVAYCSQGVWYPL